MQPTEPNAFTTPALPLRDPDTVLELDRLGSLHPYRLSFMRILIRRLMREKWLITRRQFELDDDGQGTAIYAIRTPHALYSFVAFTHRPPVQRSDRVIANAWDMTVTLCAGSVDTERLARLRANVPLQEAGRLRSDCLVLSRANKSSRNFEYVVDTLAAGRQPALTALAHVGYLYRTTAVYGSGKFGLADWQKVCRSYPDFARPFAAEMFTCYLIRHFSLEQADFLARQRAPDTAVTLAPGIRRYLGIGNATGLGMAPFLINHPLLVGRWIEVREIALARVLARTTPDPDHARELARLARKAARHLGEIDTANTEQNACNKRTGAEMTGCAEWLDTQRDALRDWHAVTEHVAATTSVGAQELINSLLTELYPALVEDLEEVMSVEETYELAPEMPLQELRGLIENRYAWALATDFGTADSQAVFWYRSEEKMEPRLGHRETDTGAEREMAVGIARSVQACHRAVCQSLDGAEDKTVADFVFARPQFRYIARRIQTLARTRYGDIHANLLAADVLPIHLLRCKLSFFGVGKFDPRSRLWVRNTMFQGAPVPSDVGHPYDDDWCFPVMPTQPAERSG